QLGGGMEAQNELEALKAQMSGAKAIEAKSEDAKAISSGSVSELDQLKQQMAEPQPAAATASAERPMQQADQSPME
ncbi:MAG: hypothetical protein II075_03620, partial [Bacteroidales bacterium]|nr:hypothetical protein [Bacteroidales bacterium]